MPASALKVVLNDAVVVTVLNVSQALAIPAGTNRVLDLQSGDQDPTYVKFGAFFDSASVNDFRMNFGKAQLIIPDAATHVHFLGILPATTILVQFGYLDPFAS